MRIILFLFLFTGSIFSQIITSTSEFPTDKDSIVIFFNASFGTQGLQGYNGDVYAHTGLITEKSNNGTDWKYVITPWPDGSNNDQANTEKNKLLNVGTDLWKLVIGFPREFYIDHSSGATIPPEEEILKLAFVFRSADGSKEGKDNDGDIFLELFEPGLTMTIDTPTVDLSFGDPRRSPIFTNSDLLIRSIAVTLGTEISSHKLYQNNVLLDTTTNDTLEYNYTPMYESGMQIFKVVGTDTSGIKDSTEFAVMIAPEILEEARPEGTVDGINYIDENTVILSLFAPYKEHVFVVGDFADWFVDENYLMKKEVIDGDSTYWWLQLSGLEGKTEYAFQYLADGEIRIADPFTEKILDPWNDKWINNETYPNLKPYPDGKTDQAVAVLETGRETYQWKTTEPDLPAKDELIIYELLVRDFIQKHDYATLIDTLDYLQNLGINAIELMPVNEFEGNESWGYNPSFYFALDKYYGLREDFKVFVDSCHARGIAVIIDKVFNHSYGQSPLARLYLEGGKPSANNPWYNREHNFQNPDAHWGYDFNHESKKTQTFFDRVIKYWLTEYKVDGFRFDFTKGFSNTIWPSNSWGSQYDASRIGILKRMVDEMWKVNPNAYAIFEHLSDNTEEKELANYGILLWGNMNYNYNEATMGYNNSGKSDFSWGYFSKRGWTKAHLVTYMESHDEERVMFKNMEYGNSSGSYNIKDLATALQRIKLAAAFFLTLPGPKMIWQFGELGYDISIDENGRVGNKPILWNYFQDTDRSNLYKTYAALLKLRKETAAFRDPNSTVNLSVSDANKRIKVSNGSTNISIIGNFDVIASEIDPSFHHGGIWYDFFTGDSIDVNDTSEKIALAPGEFHIYSDVKLETPAEDPVTALEEIIQKQPQKFELNQNYPNPFNPVTAIKYSLAFSSDVEITIYDIQGRRVKTLVNTFQNQGDYTLNFSGENFSSGAYFYTFKAGSFIQTRKMLLIK